MKKKILYFAYGSNMNLEQVAVRMPGAQHLGAATLYGYTVVERMHADVDAVKGGVVHGVLYRIGPRELAALDRYEGYPAAYTRIWREVEFEGEEVTAMLYEMTLPTKRSRDGYRYTDSYRAGCSEGARQHGIPDVFYPEKLF